MSGTRRPLARRLRPLRDAVVSADPEERDLFDQIAAEVTERRLEWGLSQRELAELCGTTQSAIARIERGARPPRIDTLARIGNALDSELIVELRPRTGAKPRGQGSTRSRERKP